MKRSPSIHMQRYNNTSRNFILSSFKWNIHYFKSITKIFSLYILNKIHIKKYLKRQSCKRFDWVPNSRCVFFCFQSNCFQPNPLTLSTTHLGVIITPYVYILCRSKSGPLKGYHSINTVWVPTLRVVRYACHKCSLNFIAICGFFPFDFAQCKVLIFLVSISRIVNNVRTWSWALVRTFVQT